MDLHNIVADTVLAIPTKCREGRHEWDKSLTTTMCHEKVIDKYGEYMTMTYNPIKKTVIAPFHLCKHCHARSTNLSGDEWGILHPIPYYTET